MTTSRLVALALTGWLSAVSLSSFADSTGPTNPIGSPPSPATEESKDSMGTGLDTNGGAIIDNSTDPRTQGNDSNRQGLGNDVENGKMGPGKNATPGDNDDIPGTPKQPTP
ncbi:hypothetical protein GIR22_22200 [Pseudomonas sp. CCM 7891]|uniref:Uncharacterized protein n=1 Tax=Pseudomonas karstica TaxID=1055468 RepID=A0A7X2RYZ7_9PSED|nr:hypothetical protein [Pseudomonas karstica]MTD21845.1 hypothetical protein [Pseudomonas karstica]